MKNHTRQKSFLPTSISLLASSSICCPLHSYRENMFQSCSLCFARPCCASQGTEQILPASFTQTVVMMDLQDRVTGKGHCMRLANPVSDTAFRSEELRITSQCDASKRLMCKTATPNLPNQSISYNRSTTFRKRQRGRRDKQKGRSLL